MGDTPEFDNLGLSDRSALEDAKAFNKGKGRLLFAMLGLLLVAVLGFGWYLVQDQPNPYGELGKQVNGLRGQYFDGFWTCALPGKRLVDLKSDADLRSELHMRATARGRYAEHLSSKCRPFTSELMVRLRALLPPQDAQPFVKQMLSALGKMDEGARDYAQHLQELEGAYVDEAAEPSQSGLVRGWYEFRKAHAGLNQLVRDQLQH